MTTPAKTAEYLVPPGAMFISKNPIDSYKSQNLSTSVLLVAFQPKPHLGVGIIHVAMPDSKIMRVVDNPLKYVDLGLNLFLQAWDEQNYDLEQTSFSVIGGSQLFNFAGDASNMLNIGLRNVILVQTILAQKGLKISHKDTGGNRPRTAQIYVSPFKVEVSQPKDKAKVLVAE